MKINYGLIFIILVVIALMVTGFAVILRQRTYGRSLDLGVTFPEYLSIEDHAGLAPAGGANNGFVFYPYQTGNPDGNHPAVIPASVSYIKET